MIKNHEKVLKNIRKLTKDMKKPVTNRCNLSKKLLNKSLNIEICIKSLLKMQKI